MIRDLVGRLTLRWRMVLLAAAVVTIILLVAGVVLTMGLRTVLTHSAIRAAQVRADELAALAVEGDPPDTIPIAGQDEALAQIVIAGQVVAASSNIAGEPALQAPTPDPGTTLVGRIRTLPIGDDDRFELVSTTVTTAWGPAVVHVAVSLDEIDETVDAAVRVGAVGLPVLVLALSAAMWLVVGRTLRPIDVMRRKADDIHGDALARRVPEPARLDEVGRLARTINGMLGRIQSSVERQRRFVGDAAHELRSPTASLRTTLETALESSQGVDWQEVGTDLLHETLRMQRLTDQLLLLARLDASTIDAHSVDVDLDHLIEQVAAQVRPDVAVDISAVEPVQVTGEPTLLLQVIQNLLDNAARHTTTSIQIALHRDGDQAVITIDDDGPGIPTDRRDHLFERFTRLDQARDRDHGGAGLGLAIVADIVTVHGGTVRIEDPPDGRGARLVVRLPV